MTNSTALARPADPSIAPSPVSSPVPPPAEHNVFLIMLPIALSVFVGFLTIGLPLPVLPLHLHYTLGLSTLVVGIAVGAQFAAALVSRAWAGGFADTKGSKRAMIIGLVIAAMSGVAYLASLAFMATSVTSLGVLLVGRVLLGCGESLIVTGALSWGVSLVGPQHAGKVMAWVGIAMYAAYSTGAPLGTLIYGSYGFAGIAVGTIIIPLLAIAVVAPARPVPTSSARRLPFYKILGTVWVPGLGLLLCSVGLGVITTFVALLFAAKNWGSASLAFTAFGVAFIGARLMFAHLPDQIGGAKVALVCVLIEAVGQLLIWRADHVMMAYAGAALTGFWFLARFSRLRRRSGAAFAPAKPRRRNGRLCGVPRHLLGNYGASGRRDCERGQRRHGLPRWCGRCGALGNRRGSFADQPTAPGGLSWKEEVRTRQARQDASRSAAQIRHCHVS